MLDFLFWVNYINNNIFTILSMIFLIIGIVSFKKFRQSRIINSVFFIMMFFSIALFISYAVINYFTGNGINEAVIFHLKYGLGGAGYLEYSWLIITTGATLLLTASLLQKFIFNKESKKNNHKNNIIAIISIFFSYIFNPLIVDIYKIKNQSLSRENKNSDMIKYFNDYYKNPSIANIKDNHKNIIFIYLESLERTYFDESIFPGLINGMRELESKSTYFTNIKQVTGTGWTIAGMTASQCGIPLLSSSDSGNSMSGMDEFLPLAICLGDLLSQSGYKLNYMGGASLDFAGKGKLFKTHGFINTMGRDELLVQLEDETYRTDWGLYDDSLFEMAYSRFIELSKTGEKFGLFTLTLDTHHPNGHPSKSCEGIQYKDASNPILNAVACTDYLLTNFVKKIAQSPYADNTVIAIASDHLAMRNTAYHLLQKKDRRNLFMIIEPSDYKRNKIDVIGSTLDIAPTLLPFLGYNGDIGLGRNLLDSDASEEDRIFIHSNLQNWRTLFTDFWSFPKIENNITINIDDKVIVIDDRSFKFPILIELDNKLQSNLKFAFYTPNFYNLAFYHHKLSTNSYFLLIDKCNNLKHLKTSLSEIGYCFLAGQGEKYTEIEKISNNITFTKSELEQLLGI